MPRKKLDDKKQIRLLQSVIESFINKQSADIINIFYGKKDINEFLIAKNLKLTINQTRNILYKLLDLGMVSFIRKKDRKKGWYIYFWTLNNYQAFVLLNEDLKNRRVNLEKQLKNRKENRHYFCKTCSIEVNEETALLNNFICSECEEVYELFDNSKIIDELEKKISKLKKEIELVTIEKLKEEEKLELVKTRKIKKADNMKKAKKAREKLINKKVTKKLAKKPAKKSKKAYKKHRQSS